MKNIVLPLILMIIFLGCWESLITTSELQFLFSKPSLILRSLITSTVNTELPKHALITGAEAFLGFVIGVFTGTAAGFVLWYSPILRISVQPFLFILGVVPVIAFAPLVLVWFGIGFSMKVALAFFATFLISLSQAFSGAQQLKEEELELLKILGATKAQILTKAVIPMSLTWVFQSMRLNIGFALLGAFVGEFISAEKGIGYFMIKAGSLYDIAGVFAGAIYLVILALLFRIVVILIENLGDQFIRIFSISRNVRSA